MNEGQQGGVWSREQISRDDNNLHVARRIRSHQFASMNYDKEHVRTNMAI